MGLVLWQYPMLQLGGLSIPRSRLESFAQRLAIMNECR